MSSELTFALRVFQNLIGSRANWDPVVHLDFVEEAIRKPTYIRMMS